MSALAATAPAPVYCAVGDGGRPLARALRRDRRLRLVRSPRHATVLLIAGELPPQHRGAAVQIHDQLPAPRASVVWGDERIWALPGAVRVSRTGDVGAVICRVHRELFTGKRRSSPPLGPADNPVEWRGVGPGGQGGEGMMGGKPYGRPMAMTGPDVRDGLELDRVAVTVGPLLPWMPPGIRLSLELQGDVIQSMSCQVATLRLPDIDEVFIRAQTFPVSIAEIELARARHHLGAIGDLLAALGLEALAERTAEVAARIGRDSRPLRRLGSALRIGLPAATRGVGVLPASAVGTSGPVARAAGHRHDARLDDPAYRELGFEVIVGARSDCEARWRQRLAEAIAAVELASRAGDRKRAPRAALEGPRGMLGRPADARNVTALCDLAPGMSWDEMVTTLVSLDIDPATLPRGVV